MQIQEDSGIAIRESFMQFVENVFPDINANFHAPEQQWISWISERAIPTNKNSSVDQISAIISPELLHEEATILLNDESTIDPRESTRFPAEFLNKLTPVELPLHHLYIDKGMVLMFQRNLSPKLGPCNGARLILDKATNILLYLSIASGDYAKEEVLIHRIEIKHLDEQFI